ncbi:hypothetical protein [uncultured Brevundimonas sp.]|uniref:hypothetical protein n=1 Tax=uncultured Brevundimonas sp. TaxID=213418 RepID=UPI0030ED5F4D|tara:strand:+ start:75505 stop:75768 length:264 start_codon:yes stop_codon:yes gene_type:complete
MSAIRPEAAAPLPGTGLTPPAQAAGNAARAAFFRAALGQVQATTPAAAPMAVARASERPSVTTNTTPTSAPDPTRPLRPGSYLDIRI